MTRRELIEFFHFHRINEDPSLPKFEDGADGSKVVWLSEQHARNLTGKLDVSGIPYQVSPDPDFGSRVRVSVAEGAVPLFFVAIGKEVA